MTPLPDAGTTTPVCDGVLTVVAQPAPIEKPSLRRVAKLVVGGSAIYMLGNALARGLNFILLPIYTRYLSPAEYGVVALAEIVAVVVGILCGLGLNGAIMRLYFEHSDSQARKNYLATMLRFALLATAAILGISYLVGPPLLRYWVPQFGVAFYPYIAIALAAAAATQIMGYRQLLYQLDGQPLRYAALVLASLAVTAACTLILVIGFRKGAVGLLGGKMVAGVASAAVSVWLMRAWLVGVWSWEHVRESLRLAIPLLPHEFMAAGLVAADRLILGHYRAVDEVGVYSVAYTLGIVMALVTNSLQQAWGPAFFNLAATGEQGRVMIGRITVTLSVGLTAAAVIGSLVAYPFVAVFLDSRYRQASTIVPWVIGGYLLHSYYGLFQLAAVQARRTQFVLVASASAFLLNLALNFWWVPKIGMYGAAYATFVAYGAEALVMVICAQRAYRISVDANRMLAALAIFCCVLLLTQRHELGVWTMVATATSAIVLLGLIVKSDARATWAMVSR